MSSERDSAEVCEPGTAREWHATVGQRLRRVLCPVYSETAHRPEPVGTGVLIRVDDLIFLVTAAHVVEDVGPGSRYFGVLDKVTPLPAVTIKTPLPASGKREEDPIDLGAWVLDPELTTKIPSADTLR